MRASLRLLPMFVLVGCHSAKIPPSSAPPPRAERPTSTTTGPESPAPATIPTEPADSGAAPEEPSPLCEALDSEGIVGDGPLRGRWAHGTLRVPLYMEQSRVADVRSALENATYRLTGHGLDLSLEPVITELDILAVTEPRGDDAEKLELLSAASELELTVHYRGACPSASLCRSETVDWTCEKTVEWHPPEPPPKPQKWAVLQGQLKGDGLTRYKERKLGAVTLEWWAPSDEHEFVDSVQGVGTCAYRRGDNALLAACPLSRTAVNQNYVVTTNLDVVPHREIWSYLTGTYEAWQADTRRLPYSPMGSVATFLGWESPHRFRVEAACCGDADVFEFDAQSMTRSHVKHVKPR